MNEDIKVITTYDIANVEILEHIGLVQGSTVRSRNVGSDMFAFLKNIRIAPTQIELDELSDAMDLFCICVLLAEES